MIHNEADTPVIFQGSVEKILLRILTGYIASESNREAFNFCCSLLYLLLGLQLIHIEKPLLS